MNEYSEEENRLIRNNLLDHSLIALGKVTKVAISMMAEPIKGDWMGYQMVIFAPTIHDSIDSVNNVQIFGGGHAPLQINATVSDDTTSYMYDYEDVLRLILTTEEDWVVSRESAELILIRENITILA